MADEGIFLAAKDKLILLRPKAYASEDVLQEALANFPQVIAGRSTDEDGEPSPLVLVAREIGIPTTQLSLDHLFLDHEAVPVLVEVKRASDTRIRREVVAQMLDYAANAAANWPVSYLEEKVAQAAEQQGTSVEEYLAPVAQDGPEAFWRDVAQNLKAGRVRLMFVADVIPESLERIIDFLNEQMSPAEVLGVEVRKYEAGGHLAYVPRLVGRTSDAVAAKSSRPGTRWTKETFVEWATVNCSGPEAALVERVLEHAQTFGAGKRLAWGSGVSAGVGGWYDLDGRPSGCWTLNLGDGAKLRPHLVVYFGDILKFSDADHVAQFADVLADIPAAKAMVAQARADGWKRWPSFSLAELATQPEQVASLLRALDSLPRPLGRHPAAPREAE